MVQPRIEADPSFLQFADSLAQEVSGGQGRLNIKDPDSVRKLFGAVDASATEFEAQTGQPKERTFEDIFSSLGTGIGAIGRGLRGAGRALAENQPFQSPVSAEQAAVLLEDPVTGRPTELGRVLDTADAIAQTGAGFGTEILVEPVVRGAVGEDNSFTRFVQDLEQRRGQARLGDLLALQSERDAFRAAEFDPATRLALEVGFDPLNVIPGSAAARLASRTGRVAARGGQEVAESVTRRGVATAEEIAQQNAQRVANEAIRRGDDLGEAAIQAAAPPSVPQTAASRIRGAVDEVIPVGQADAAGPEAGERVTRFRGLDDARLNQALFDAQASDDVVARTEILEEMAQRAFRPDDSLQAGAAGSLLDEAVSGQPFQGRFLRGFGRESREAVFSDRVGTQQNVFGDATYSTPNREFAQSFGPQIEQVDVALSNPLVISTDAEYGRLINQAGWKTFTPQSRDDVARMRNLITNRGHDGVIVRVPETELTGKRLQQVFSEDTVVDFRDVRPDVQAATAGPEDLSIVDEFVPNAQGGFDRVSTTVADDIDSFMRNIPEAQRLSQRIDEIGVILESDLGVIKRPPWATGLTNQEIRAVARQEGLDPTVVDWADGLDPVVISEARQRFFRNPNEPSATQLRVEQRSLRQQLREVNGAHQTIRSAADNVQPNGTVRTGTARQVETAQETIANNAPTTPASSVDSELAQLEREIATARVRLGSTGGTPPPRRPGTAQMGGSDVPPPRRPDVAFTDDLEIPVHENPTTAVFRKWSGARNVERLQINEWFRRGQQAMRRAGIGNTNRRTPELELLFKTLHGEEDVALLRPAWRAVHNDLRRIMDMESADMRDFLTAAQSENVALFGLDSQSFIDRMMAHPDYFPRGWKERPQAVSQRGRVGTRPGFTRPRVDATFTELLDSGLEPVSWNPYAMLASRRLAGVEYREQVKALHIFKRRGSVLPEGEAPLEGWRVPQIGPAFQGRPVGPGQMSQRYAVPNRLATEMEALWGGGRTDKEWLRKFERTSNVLKRTKLIGSFFQHIDFLTRAGGSLFAPESIARGNFVKAPSMAAQMFRAQWWPAARRNLQREILSGKPLYTDFDISLRMVAENGWEVAGDRSLIRKAFLDHIDEAVGAEGRNRALNGFNEAKNFFEQGLFEGVYTVSQTHALKNFIIPSLRRQHPTWTAQQIAGQAAEQVNVMFSTLGDWQTILRFAGDDLRSATRSLIFSSNESESLIRGAIRGISFFSPVKRSPHARQFAQWYIGMFIFMAGIANAVHFAATGKALPAGAYNPIDTEDGFSPFDVGYNTRFLSPEMPFLKGRNDLPVHMDIVGQMDTAFNWALKPQDALAARTNVLPRAFTNQLGTGENFFGEPLQTPGQRIGQAALDLGAPIGAQAAIGAASEALPALQQVFPAAESRLGVAGQLAQASGVNFRALRNQELRDLREQRPELTSQIDQELERRAVEQARRNPTGFTSVLQARLRDAREQGDALAIRAIEAELRGRGVPETAGGAFR